MMVEFFLNLCFIQVQVREESFIDQIEAQLQQLFTDKGGWIVKTAQEAQLEIVLAEVQGIWDWENEDMIFAFLEQEASSQFWEWLQGYQLELDPKEEVHFSYCNMK
jgi:hypothetical protein